MTPEERMATWDNLNLEIELGNALIATATEAQEFIMDRVQQTGIDAKGVAYRDYTKQYKKYKMGLVNHKPTTKNKNLTNKYKGFTDFSFTNRMWISVGIVSSQEEANNGKVVITAKGANRDILKYNVERRGEILDVSESELTILKQAYAKRVDEAFKRAGL